MGMVAPPQRIASGFFVLFGNYGDVRRHAQEQGVSRQRIYQLASQTIQTLDRQPWREENKRLRQRLRDLEKQNADLQQRLEQAVVLDEEKQAEFATVGQAIGVSLPNCRTLMTVLSAGPVLSVPTLGRRTKAAGEKAGRLLQVLDEAARARVRQAAADEIYVSDPVLMAVEPESLCWTSGRLSAEVSGEAWAEEFRQLPNLEQVMRDGGKGLAKGVALLNADRQAQGRPQVVDQGDHYHAARGGGVALRHAERRAAKALSVAETAQQELEECQRQGRDARGASRHARAAWQRAEQAMDTWSQHEQRWQQAKQALRLVTPEGECNTRAKAEAVLSEALAQLPDSEWGKTKRSLQQPEMLAYLDHVQNQVVELPFAKEVKEAAVQQECLRRRPELLEGEGQRAAAMRGMLLVCAVVLAQSGTVGAEAAAAVRKIFRTAYRASSLVECINSVLRMQQARHRKMSQGLLDLKRLYWNCHEFRTGRRRGTSPYQRLGIGWPEGVGWWDVLKWSPEQLRAKLSTAKTAE